MTTEVLRNRTFRSQKYERKYSYSERYNQEAEEEFIDIETIVLLMITTMVFLFTCMPFVMQVINHFDLNTAIQWKYLMLPVTSIIIFLFITFEMRGGSYA